MHHVEPFPPEQPVETGKVSDTRTKREVMNSEPSGSHLLRIQTDRLASRERVQLKAILAQERRRLNKHHLGTGALERMEYVEDLHSAAPSNRSSRCGRGTPRDAALP